MMASTRRASDTRVIISACQIENQRGSPVYLALYGPKGLVIFDHPYYGGSMSVLPDLPHHSA
jgi:hypothetical protein